MLMYIVIVGIADGIVCYILMWCACFTCCSVTGHIVFTFVTSNVHSVRPLTDGHRAVCHWCAVV